MMFGTTSGEWRLEEGFEDLTSDHGCIEIRDENGFPIADVHFDPLRSDWAEKYPGMRHWSEGSKDGRTVIERPPEEVIANAVLMAASPKLREACISALALVKTMKGTHADLVARELRIALSSAAAP